jgi:hypothetical protein
MCIHEYMHVQLYESRSVRVTPLHAYLLDLDLQLQVISITVQVYPDTTARPDK